MNVPQKAGLTNLNQKNRLGDLGPSDSFRIDTCFLPKPETISVITSEISHPDVISNGRFLQTALPFRNCRLRHTKTSPELGLLQSEALTKSSYALCPLGCRHFQVKTD
jgi:hypothetical protein